MRLARETIMGESLLRFSPNQSRRPAIQPVSQCALLIDGEGSASAFNGLMQSVLGWMERRSGRPLPSHAHDGKSFVIDDIGSQRTEAISIEAPRYWAARIDDADKNVPQRTWTTEIALAPQADGRVLFGTRLQCVSRGQYEEFDASVPNFVREVVESGHAWLDGIKISAEPMFIETEDDADELCKLLWNRGRRSDVIVFSLPEDSNDWSETIIPARDVARRLAGAAHVAIVSQAASYRLTDQVGKALSVYRQAVRTYRPGFDPSLDEAAAHPLGLPNRIANWAGGPQAYRSFLVNQTLNRTVSGRDSQRQLPPFLEVKRVAGELRRQSARIEGDSDRDLLALAEQEIRDLTSSLEQVKEEQDSFIALADQEREEAEQQAEQQRQSNVFLRHRISLLESRLAQSAPPQVELPDSLEGFENWCREHLSGSVELHSRAFQGIKKSQFDDVQLIYRSLLLLRDFYVPMRRGGGEAAKAAYDTECAHLGLDEQPSFAGAGWGEHGDTYLVRWGKSRLLLDRHLKKGNSREERFCFRLYFAWVDDDQHVLVGWLPSHLDTRAT